MPTHQMAMAWLREVYNLYIEIFVTWKNKIPHYQWRIDNLITQDTIVDTPCLEKPEESAEAALKYCLENLIQGMTREDKDYLYWRCKVNWHNKYHRYINEWISNVLPIQLEYFRKEMNNLINRGIYESRR